MANGTVNDDDETQKAVIEGTYKIIEMYLQTGRKHMAGTPGCRPDIVDFMLSSIASHAENAKGYSWPDPKARMLAAAKKDRTLQKTLTKASRKTLIRGD